MGQIDPGNWIGVFGGGQLGRMLTHVAQARGYHVAIFESEVGCPAAQSADRHFCPADTPDNVKDLVDSFAQSCQAITLEFENVPADWVRWAARHTATRPGAEFLEICQHRVLEKSSLRSAGYPVTPFRPVQSLDQLKDAGKELGWPLVLKTCRSGYDGKGQVMVHTEADAEPAWKTLNNTDCIAEQKISYIAEVSMLAARNARGQIVPYPLVENQHANHILDVSSCPVSPALSSFETQAKEIVIGVADTFQVQGLFCVEFFVDAQRGLLINEMAPRPHNSGHLTIEAFSVSQFEQQLRAACNLPLKLSKDFRPAAMANLLGDLWYMPPGSSSGQTPPLAAPRSLNWEDVLATEHSYLHLYGKQQPRIGRKMGHLTCTGNTVQEAIVRVKQLRATL